MLDNLIEGVLDLVLDGAMEAVGSKRVALPIRILLGGILLALALGLIGLLFWVGIDTDSTGLIILAVVLLVALGGWVFASVRRHRRKTSR